jgi:anti-sigma factor RsiW
LTSPVDTHDDEMACQELVEVVTDYLEGALGADDRRRFEAHLAECPFCTEYVEQMRTVAGTLRGLREGTGLSAGARDALLDAFRGWREH